MRVLIALLLALVLTGCSATYVQVESNPPPKAPPPEQEEPAEGIEQAVHFKVDTVMHGDTVKAEEDITLFSYAVEVPELTAWREDGTQITQAATDAEERALQMVDTFAERFVVWYAEETLEELEKTAREELAFYREAGADWNYGYQLELDCTVYQTEKLVSISGMYYAYTGGAHPNTYLLGWTFDLESGSFYGPEGMAGQTELQEAVSAEIIRQAAERAAEAGMTPEEFFWPEYQEIIGEWPNYAVSFNEEGMTVAFSPYELAAYAAGPQEFYLSYEWLSVYLDEHGMDVLGLK